MNYSLESMNIYLNFKLNSSDAGIMNEDASIG